MTMKMVYICSPLRGNVSENIKRANEYCLQVAKSGDLAIAPHCVFTQYLDDNISAEREMGIKMGLELLKRCDELLVCGGTISEGMKEEMREAYRLNIPIKSQTLSAKEMYQVFENGQAAERTMQL